MNKNEIYKMCKKAFEEGKVKELLKGDGVFACIPDKSVPAHIPTDWSMVFENGIYKLRDNITDEEICEKIKIAFYDLLQGSVVDVWIAFSIFFELLYNEKKGYSDLKIIDREMQGALTSALYFNEKQLKECYLWQGLNKTDGLWNDIIGANKSIKQLFGVSVL